MIRPIPPMFAGRTKLPKGVYTLHFVDGHGAALSSSLPMVDQATLKLGKNNPNKDMLLLPNGTLQLLTRHYKGWTDRMMTLLGTVHRQMRGETVVGQEAQADQVRAALTDKVRAEMRQDSALRHWLERDEIIPAHLASLMGRISKQLPLRDVDFFEDASELVSADVAHRTGGVGSIVLTVLPKGRYKVASVTPPRPESI